MFLLVLDFQYLMHKMLSRYPIVNITEIRSGTVVTPVTELMMEPGRLRILSGLKSGVRKFPLRAEASKVGGTGA